MPRILVIVPTFSHFDYAKITVTSLMATTKDVVPLVVDDASKDWERQNWKTWPAETRRHHFAKNGGLTRSWNHGLRVARDEGFEFAVCANSDLVFTPNWFCSIEWALTHGADLVGPLTNAPGHKPKQQIKNYIPDYRVTDDRRYLEEVARRVRERHGSKVFLPGSINGFCMAAQTKVWWEGAFDAASGVVFNPKKKLTGNEDELQRRWGKKKKVLAIVVGSFVFHYRGVTRPGGKNGRDGAGWFRRKQAHGHAGG